MLKVGIITHELSKDFEYALEVVKELGIKYIELHSLWNKTIENLSEKEVEKAKNLVKKYQLMVSNVSSTCFLLCPLWNSREKLRNINENFIALWGDYSDHLSYLKRSIQLAQVFDTDLVRIFGFRKMDPYQQLDKKVLNQIVNKFEEPVKLAEQAGITLVLENCPYSYLGEGRLTSKVLEQINSKNIKLLWDPANATSAGSEPYPKDYQFVRDNMAHIHFRDLVTDKVNKQVKFVPIGKGEINYRAILQALQDDGYKGVISLEPECISENGSPESGTKKSFDGIKKILDNLDIEEV